MKLDDKVISVLAIAFTEGFLTAIYLMEKGYSITEIRNAANDLKKFIKEY